MASNVHVRVIVDQERLDRVARETYARMRRLSRKRRKQEWPKIVRRISACVSLSCGFDRNEAKAI